MASFKLAPKIFTYSAARDSETDFLPFGYSYFRMTKRKIDNTTTIIDLDPPISEISNLCTHSQRKKITNQDHEEKFLWFLNIPRRKRSKWKISPKNADHDADAVSKHYKKQDSRALISRKNAEDGTDAVSKQDKKPNSRALISLKNAVDGANAVSKQDKKLDSKALVSHKNAVYDADAVSKQDKKLSSRALISRKNAEDGADAVSKQDKKPNSQALISLKNAVDGANAVSKQDKKLDSKALVSHKNAVYDADAVSKQDKKLSSRALISRKNAEDGADAVSKQVKKPNLVSLKNAVDDANAVSKQDKKLDSRALVSHKNADYDADAVSKQDKKLSSRALVRHKDADNADEVSKRTNKLDSGIFECYLENLWRSFSEDQKTSCTYFDCLWFTLYKKVTQRSKVLSWIKKKHIFLKKYVFVPIVCWSHWSLLILCHFGESLQSESRTTCMLLLDSLEGADPRRLEPDIRKFIFDIYKAEGRPETKDQIRKIPLLVPKVPQQRDGEECGSFVLYFINLFMEGAPEDFSMKGYPYFMKQSWFTREGLECFLKRLDSFPK